MKATLNQSAPKMTAVTIVAVPWRCCQLISRGLPAGHRNSSESSMPLWPLQHASAAARAAADAALHLAVEGGPAQQGLQRNLVPQALLALGEATQ